jgi:hypothetical protein
LPPIRNSVHGSSVSALAFQVRRESDTSIPTASRRNALLFPFHEQGAVTYIQARMFEGEKKFLNPRGVAKPLFNTDRLRGLRAGKLVHLCEGVPDAIALGAQGVVAVGVLGATSFRADWVDRFLRFRVVLLGDGDAAGAKFAKDIPNFFMERCMAASGAKYGIMTSHFYWVGAIPAMVFLAIFMMPFYYSSKARSVPEYLKLCFDEKPRGLNVMPFAVMKLCHNATACSHFMRLLRNRRSD